MADDTTRLLAWLHREIEETQLRLHLLRETRAIVQQQAAQGDGARTVEVRAVESLVAKPMRLASPDDLAGGRAAVAEARAALRAAIVQTRQRNADG